jgi:transposase
MSRQHYGEDHSTNNNTARCCAATRRGLAAGCDWPVRTTIATLMIGNDERGYAEAIAWVAEHAPGPRVVVGLEGTRSYGIGLARVLQAAGLTVVEIERPRRGERRRGKSDPIDAHLAALHALRLDADRLPTPRADGDREAARS